MANEQNQVKKVSRVPKIFKSKIFVFAISVVLFLFSSMLVLALDQGNTLRPNWGLFNWLRYVFVSLGIGDFNITAFSWFVLFGFFAVLYVILFASFFAKGFINSCNNRHLKRKGKDLPKAGKFFIGLLFVLVFLALAGGAMVGLYFLLPESVKAAIASASFNLNELVNLLISIAIMVAALLAIPLAFAILYFAVWALLKIIGAIVSGVSRNVISSSAYQEAKVATELANAKLKQEAGKAAGASLAGGVGGQHLEANECLFPALTKIDLDYANKEEVEEVASEEEKLTFDRFQLLAYEFQSYLCAKKYYFDINILRSFIAGLAASRLILLQGLSGTGKSTLPRMFAEYTKSKATFYPVQATWRDRTDITGYYSDLVGEFKETELLKNLYRASYEPKTTNLMVLDEMNISRVEYYFADFLSTFEYPASEWLVNLMQLKPEEAVNAPKKLEDGSVRIPENTWFVGTVNIDDSTFTITDKVYDRAIVIDFKELNIPFTSTYNSEPHPISVSELNAMFEEAKGVEDNMLEGADREKFISLCAFTSDTFDIRFGNRIMNQIDNFLPVFVALGGSKEEALDIMFARKILRKLDGKYESYIKDALVKLQRFINQTYGKHVFKETELLIENIRKKLS